jgi:hypothetical protein
MAVIAGWLRNDTPSSSFSLCLGGLWSILVGMLPAFNPRFAGGALTYTHILRCAPTEGYILKYAPHKHLGQLVIGVLAILFVFV